MSALVIFFFIRNRLSFHCDPIKSQKLTAKDSQPHDDPIKNFPKKFHSETDEHSFQRRKEFWDALKKFESKKDFSFLAKTFEYAGGKQNFKEEVKLKPWKNNFQLSQKQSFKFSFLKDRQVFLEKVL